MPLYGFDGKESIYAPDALPNTQYRCLECKSPLKLRRGKYRTPHFYHIQTSPSCRLYSKSEDHLLVQLQIQKLYAPGAIQMEVPFLAVHRVADLLWEKEKIIFEIQCSSIQSEETENRIRDYRRLGYEIVWLLDDRLFNRRAIRPAEKFLRTHCCYFFHFQRNSFSLFYDQLEIHRDIKRIKKSKRIQIDLKKPLFTPKMEWPSYLPLQISDKIPNCPRFFRGDLIDRSLKSIQIHSLSHILAHWKMLEASIEPPSIPSILLEKPTHKYKTWLEEKLELLT
jgi:competence CoiA-like predicted nuclease